MKIKSDSRFLYLLLIFVLIIPIIHPLGLPVQVSKLTREAYDIIDTLPEGSIVVYFNDASVGGWTSVEWISYATVQHLFNRPIKIVFLTVGEPAAVFITENYLLPKIDKNDKVYGEDYVHLGLVPGAEIAVAALAKDVHKTVMVDHHGIPIEDLPIMEEFRNHEDIDLVVTNVSSLLMQYVRQLYVPYNIPIVAAVQGTSIQLFMPYYEGGQISAMLCDIAAAGEYELILGKPSGAIKFSDVLSVGYLFMIVLIVAGNIEDLVKRRGYRT